jgi:hypothetical protein
VAGGSVCRFEAPGSAITWHPRLGVAETQGAIGEHWLRALGGPAGRWGFPASDEYDAGGCRAQDFEGGTVQLRDRIVTLPRRWERAWLTVLEQPPLGGRPAAPRHHATVTGICRQIDHTRSLLDLEPPPANRRRRVMTTVSPDEALAAAGTTLPPGVSTDRLLQAVLDLWRDLSGGDGDPPAPVRADGLTWAGFGTDGELQSLMATLFHRAPESRRLFLRVGVDVQRVGSRLAFVVADTAHGRRLHADPAERLIAGDRRLLSLFDHLAAGSVPPALLADAGLASDANSGLRQAMLDAQFLAVAALAGGLPGWSLLPPWNRRLRAAVAANLRAGCLTGWQPYEHTDADPVEVVRAMVWDFFCGPAVLASQSADRFEGPLGRGALAAAADRFPPVTDGDDGHARYILVGGVRRRVDGPPGAPRVMRAPSGRGG